MFTFMMHEEPFCSTRMSLKAPKIKVLKSRGGLFFSRKLYEGDIGRQMFKIKAIFHEIRQGILDSPLSFCEEKITVFFFDYGKASSKHASDVM